MESVASYWMVTSEEVMAQSHTPLSPTLDTTTLNENDDPRAHHLCEEVTGQAIAFVFMLVSSEHSKQGSFECRLFLRNSSKLFGFVQMCGRSVG